MTCPYREQAQFDNDAETFCANGKPNKLLPNNINSSNLRSNSNIKCSSNTNLSSQGNSNLCTILLLHFVLVNIHAEIDAG